MWKNMRIGAKFVKFDYWIIYPTGARALLTSGSVVKNGGFSSTEEGVAEALDFSRSRCFLISSSRSVWNKWHRSPSGFITSRSSFVSCSSRPVSKSTRDSKFPLIRGGRRRRWARQKAIWKNQARRNLSNSLYLFTTFFIYIVDTNASPTLYIIFNPFLIIF